MRNTWFGLSIIFVLFLVSETLAYVLMSVKGVI